MARIQLYKGLQGKYLPQSVVVRGLNFDLVVQQVAQLRKDVEEIAELKGCHVEDSFLPVAILLADFAEIISSNPVEKEIMLGSHIQAWIGRQGRF
jgi:hypothetical protein